ncbi:MAG: META domain-containing protein [Minisyncoccia bacterium]
MKKTIGIIAGILILVTIFGWGVFRFRVGGNDSSIGVNIGASSPKDATYKINGKSVTLSDGVYEESLLLGSASKTITRYFGNEVKHDFDGDGMEDTAFLLTQETGGSGTFYYLAVALNKADGYLGSDATIIGDRIAPQTTEMGKGNIVLVNYADRNPNEPFTVKPSLGKSIWLLFDPKTMQFGEVAQNFEGEADPARMTLDMNTWKWISTTYSDGKKITPRDSNRFTLTLKKDKTFSASTDCNGGGGGYTTSGNKLSFERMMSTLMYCEGSQEADFSKSLSEVASYHFTSKGELIFELKYDSGVMVFR